MVAAEVAEGFAHDGDELLDGFRPAPAAIVMFDLLNPHQRPLLFPVHNGAFHGEDVIAVVLQRLVELGIHPFVRIRVYREVAARHTRPVLGTVVPAVFVVVQRSRMRLAATVW